MTVILLGLASGVTFGLMTMFVRLGLQGARAATATVATLFWALLLAVVAALPDHDLRRTWQYFLAGLLAPGCSQILFTLAVREAGPSRTSIAVGGGPLVAVAVAFVFLDEPVRLLLVLGALAIVGGGALLAFERDRPDHVRLAGLLAAAGAAVCFAVRDDIARALHAGANPQAAAAAVFLAGLLVASLWARGVPSRTELLRLAPAGLCFGISYLCAFAAYFRGRVSVVSPLIATESLWTVLLAALFLRHERVGVRLAGGALLVVAGGVLIGLGR
jgi:drug/metabolite transporter (DMT)-like permease